MRSRPRVEPEPAFPSTAIVLAAGKGGRFEERGSRQHKSLIKLRTASGNRAILDHLIENLRRAGVTRVLVVTGHLHPQLSEHIRKHRREHPGLLIGRYHMPKSRGTADPLHDAVVRKFILSDPSSRHFLVLNADTVTDANLRTVFHDHLAHDRPLTLMTAWVPASLRSEFGMVETRPSNLLKAIHEKPKHPGPGLEYANAGVYAVRRDVMEKNNLGEARGMDTLIKRVAERMKGGVWTFPHAGVWMSVDDERRLRYVQDRLKKRPL